jgi:regulator of protease activity HflC (stomatin/prohibitin superfamily)
MAPLIGYYKSNPTDYVLLFQQGQVRRSGPGLAFFYWSPTSSIVSIPVSTVDIPFILNEMTGNFQAVTVQGQVTYRVANPGQLAGLLNFAVDPRTHAYLSTDPEKLPHRIVNALQTHLRAELLRRALEDTLRQAADIGTAVMAQIRAEPVLAAMGVECLTLVINSIKPTPEMAKALEAEYREGLQQRADQAIYTRRAVAVEQERRIKENELNTQVTLEQKRQELVDLAGQNSNRQSEYDARSNDIWLEPWRRTSPGVLLGLAFKLMGENAQHIGNLTITPEILTSLLDGRSGAGQAGRES